MVSFHAHPSLDRLRLLGPYDSWQVVPPQVTEEGELFSDVIGVPAAGSHTLRFHGGTTIKSPSLFLIYAGFQGDKTQVEAFCTDLMTDGYLSKLANYGSGNGHFLGSITSVLPWPNTASDGYCQAVVNWAIQQPSVPKPDGSTIYAVLFGPNTTVQALGGSSCSTFCGYHSAFGGSSATYYNVIPDTSCPGCHGSLLPFQALCMIIGHEVAETVTNGLGNGWYEDSTGEENADICAWQPVSYGPWTVQPYWTNEEGCIYGTYQQQQPGGSNDLLQRVEALELGVAQANQGLANITSQLAAFKRDLLTATTHL